jgi:hypothetical protein
MSNYSLPTGSAEDSADLIPPRVFPAKSVPTVVSLEWNDLGNFRAQEICFRLADESVLQEEPISFPSLNYSPETSLPLELMERLAGGETVRMPHPELERSVSGTLRWFWWMPGDEDPLWCSNWLLPFLEFLPDAEQLEGRTFDDWRALRFPNIPDAFSPSSEEFLLFLHRIWREETCPTVAIAPDESLLYRACVENWERLVAEILHERRVEADPNMLEKITETALGVAMENQGKFGAGPGFASGCHRRYREDDFCEAEDRATWVPRAERIEKMLRQAGAVDYQPLIKACGDGSFDEVRRLLDAGYPPNFAIYGYSTPLCEAVVEKQVKICRLLLERGSNPNLPRPFDAHMTWGGKLYPLALALDHPEIVGMLLDAGADATICGDDFDSTPVVFFGGYGTKENAETIFRRVDFGSIRNYKGMTGVHFLGAGDLAMCREFVPAALLDEPDHAGRTPLVQAIMNSQNAKASLLLQMGASPSAKSWVHEVPSFDLRALRDFIPCLLTPAQVALFAGSLDLLETILAMEPEPETTAWRLDGEVSLSSEVLGDLYRRFLEDEAACEESSNLLRPKLQLGQLRFAIEKEIQGFLRGYPRFSMDGEACRVRYPELIVTFDVLEAAAKVGVPSHFLATWRAGRPLTASQWLGLASETLEDALTEADCFAVKLQSYHAGVDKADMETPCYRGLLGWIDQAGEFIERASAIIEDREPMQRPLSADICAIAAGEFDGGAARARKNVAQDEGVEFDDFLEAIHEAIQPGSTMDLGKLLQASRNAIVQLQAESVELMRRL